MAPLLVGACADSPRAVTCGEPTRYRIDDVDLPENSYDWPWLGTDLTGDGNVDNALGSVVESIQGDAPAPMSALASARLTGDVTWEAAVASCDDGTRRVRIGNSGGLDTVPLTLFADPSGASAPVVWSRADGLVARISEADDVLEMVVAFGLPVPEDRAALVTPFAAYVTQQIAAGTAPWYASDLDANHDGVITPEEVAANSYVQTLLEPDVTLDGASCLSAGMYVHGMRVP
jgi:hypothetical protein